MNNHFLMTSIFRRKHISLFLLGVTTILAFVIIGGTYFLLMLQNGMLGFEKRLGADIMVVPSECEEKAESILLEGTRECFYFDRSVLDGLQDVEGIEAVTEQFYLTSLSADCCTSQVQIVGFSPETDFVITPWVKSKDRNKIVAGKAVAGSRILLEKDNTVKIFGKKYEVVSTLAETGTSLDTSVYFPMDTMSEIIENAQKKGVDFLPAQRDENTISSVFIKVKSGEDEHLVIKDLILENADKIDVVFPGKMFKSFSQNTNYLISSIKAFLLVIWMVAEIILIIICYLYSNSRRKEYALLRIQGVGKRQLSLVLVKQMLLITTIGYILGVLLTLLIVFPFGRYLTYCLGIAYITPGVKEVLILLFAGFFVLEISGVISAIVPVSKITGQDAYTVLREEE